MIQIDDAGSGSLIGGICIAAIRKETNEFYYEIVPVELFNYEHFKEKLYIYYTTNVVKNALKKLKVKSNEKIEICQGYIFEDTRKYLLDKHYNYESTKIGEPLQCMIEHTFEDYAVSIGLPKDFITYTKYPFHFHKLLKWVYADYEQRTEFCKTGWKSWNKYGHLAIDTYYDKLLKSKYICLKCGNRISDHSNVKVLKFVTNKSYYIYLHKKC
jgi:hypothetical protein